MSCGLYSSYMAIARDASSSTGDAMHALHGEPVVGEDVLSGSPFWAFSRYDNTPPA